MNKALKIVLISAAGLAAVTAVAGLAYNLEAGARAWVGGSVASSESSAQAVAVTAQVQGGNEFPAASGTMKQVVFTVTPAETADKTVVIGGFEGQFQDIRFADSAGNFVDSMKMPTYQSGETAYLKLDGTFTGDRVLDLWPEADPSNLLTLTFTCASASETSSSAPQQSLDSSSEGASSSEAPASSSSQAASVSASVVGGLAFPRVLGTTKQMTFAVSPSEFAQSEVVIGGWDGQYQDIRFVDYQGNYLDGSGMPTYRAGDTAYLRLDAFFAGDRVLELWPEASPTNVLKLAFTCASA